ncbi:MAG: phosphotransferase [Bacteroidia bacterium]|nr:phosphotransferase [Bacteroidia bacterium]
MNNVTENKLKELYSNWAGEPAENMHELPRSGSYRQYFRIRSRTKSCMGVCNEVVKENGAFLSFTHVFLKHNLPVPRIYSVSPDNKIYLLEDLGDTLLYSLLPVAGDPFSEELVNLYKKALQELVRLQIVAGRDIDYSLCCPRDSFDRQSMLWDLNYFKYYFAKLSGVLYDEQKLENDFNTLCDFLLQADCHYFIFRDFQSRNIMIINGNPYFIDYQGGRKGALQYDLASLVYQAKASVPADTRNELIDFYIETACKYPGFDKIEFLKYFPAYVLIRIVQTLGAYGFRGFYENKAHFISSIPYAVANLDSIMSQGIGVHLPEMTKVFSGIIEKFGHLKNQKPGGKLTVTISSFSYNAGIPDDENRNGGGHVFDCRALYNPGRYPEYKDLTGKDDRVIRFLESESDVAVFLSRVFNIVDYSVERYLDMQYENLAVNFGCTGGQHRSVYCAEKLSEHLHEKYDIGVIVRHTALTRQI